MSDADVNERSGVQGVQGGKTDGPDAAGRDTPVPHPSAAQGADRADAPAPTVRAVLADAARTLTGERGASDARYLMCALLGCGTASLTLHLDDALDEVQVARFSAQVARRHAGEPLQHIVGTAPFRNLEVEVTPDVLIPRPETEMLVDLALADLVDMREVMGQDAQESPLRVLDLCCGSGCIAIAIATEAEQAGAGPVEVVAADVSGEALRVAARNVARYGASEQVELLQGDLYDALETLAPGDDVFDLIVSNPPYVPDGAMRELPDEVSLHEPKLALAGGADGLDIYRRILAGVRGHLARGGSFACELYEDAVDAAAELARASFIRVQTVPDLTGRLRFVHAGGLWSSAGAIRLDPDDPDEDDVELAAASLILGQPVIFPTDTVYGIGIAVQPHATPEKIYAIKRRDAGKPIAWLVGADAEGDVTAPLARFGREVPAYADALARAFWPGALTLIVRASERVPAAFASSAGTVALRMPDSAVARMLIDAVGMPLATSSANMSGDAPACAVDDLDACLTGQVSLVLDAGPTKTHVASTVVSCMGAVPQIVRAGSITEEDINEVCEKVY